LVARIALLTIPFYSHVQAAARLGAVLAEQGHDLTLWAPEHHRAEAEAIGARLSPHSPEMPRGSGFTYAAAMVALIESSAETLIDQLQEQHVDLLVRDAQALWAMVAADYLGIPQVVAHPLFPSRGPDTQDGSGPDADGTEESRSRASYEATWRSIARRWGVELADVSGLNRAGTTSTVVFTIEEIIGPAGLPSRWSCIGPLMPPPPKRPPPRPRPLVYASFGTSHNARQDLFHTVIEALREQPLDLLVSTGGGPVQTRDLEPLPPNVEVREFVPAREVLAGAVVHISHGGCNSVHESLLAEVPLICLPQGFDQLPLSDRLEELGVGRRVPEEPIAIRTAVAELAKYRDRAQLSWLSRRLREYDGAARLDTIVTTTLAGESTR
jgi:MGT family glycosyltransferase